MISTSINLTADSFQTGVVIVNIIPGSLAEKDKRLQVFDQIIDINTTKMTDLTSELVQRAVKQVQSKVSGCSILDEGKFRLGFDFKSFSSLSGE
jgi:C-terminal processing protease CtpA/Prc